MKLRQTKVDKVGTQDPDWSFTIGQEIRHDDEVLLPFSEKSRQTAERYRSVSRVLSFVDSSTFFPLVWRYMCYERLSVPRVFFWERRKSFLMTSLSETLGPCFKIPLSSKSTFLFSYFVCLFFSFILLLTFFLYSLNSPRFVVYSLSQYQNFGLVFKKLWGRKFFTSDVRAENVDLPTKPAVTGCVCITFGAHSKI